jgi:hypothetical protein
MVSQARSQVPRAKQHLFWSYHRKLTSGFISIYYNLPTIGPIDKILHAIVDLAFLYISVENIYYIFIRARILKLFIRSDPPEYLQPGSFSFYPFEKNIPLPPCVPAINIVNTEERV